MKKKKGSGKQKPAQAAPRAARGLWIAGLAAVVILLFAWLALRGPMAADRSTPDASLPAAAPSPGGVGEPPTLDPSVDLAGYVGSTVCANCHAAEVALWQASQHRRAMLPATPGNVQGAFDGSTLADAGSQARLSRAGVDFIVHAAGRDGAPSDHRVAYVFGVEPLQQYLVALPDGRLQAVPFAWDSRAKQAGGQRWFHLYPDARVAPGDPLHWTRPAQNWNHVCADCHTTGFRKRYDAAKDVFDSRWEELGVGCESCHGPGRAHVVWAKAGKAATGAMGLAARLDERRDVQWAIDPVTGNAVRSAPRTSARELDVCAPCHARRSNLSERYVAGEPFLDHYRPALLEPDLYYADGQQRDEVYTWGSFLQSRMYSKGVTCSDCHDPHTGKLRAEGNALCANCHAPAKYAGASHHHHAEGSAGSQCVACHMPTTTYMQVDPRHDHSLRVPRPDQSVALGVPNACNACHVDRKPAWADAAVRRWLGRPAQGFERHAEALHASDSGAGDAGPRLRAVAGDPSQPAIVRASALARLDTSQSSSTADLLARAAMDPEPLVRLGALEGLLGTSGPVRAKAAAALLRDPRRAVRFGAVRVLASVVRELSPADRGAFEQSAEEYVAALRRDADRAESRTQLGLFLAELGDGDGARRELEAAIRIEPAYEPAYVNLADLERALARDEEAMRVLDAGLGVLPESAALHHVRGLARVRLGRTEEANGDLARAAALDPGSARFAYVYAVALQSAGDLPRAVEILEQATAAHPGDRAILEALVGFHEQAGDASASLRDRAALARLAELDP